MTAYRSKADRWAGRRGVNEGFDFTGMSDIDYTDTFADIDQVAEDEAAFTAGLRKALFILVCKPDGTDAWVKGTDSRLDPLFAGAVSGSPADGWRVSFSAATLEHGGTGLKPASSSFGRLYWNVFPGGAPVMDVLLDLKAAPAAWSKSARWRLEQPGPGVTKYELYILPGKRDRSLAGSPEYVAGDVIAGMHWRTTYIMGIGNYMPSLLPVCRSLAAAPKEITGNFDCMIDPDAEYGPGFLNGAPLTVGGRYFTVTFPPDDPSEEDGRSGLRTGSFLWDSEGNIIPAFTDGMARRYGGSIKVNILHPAPDVSRRRKTQDLCIDHRGVRKKELSDLMFPDAEFTCVYTQVRGNPDACINWLCEVNGVGGVIR